MLVVENGELAGEEDGGGGKERSGCDNKSQPRHWALDIYRGRSPWHLASVSLEMIRRNLSLLMSIMM